MSYTAVLVCLALLAANVSAASKSKAKCSAEDTWFGELEDVEVDDCKPNKTCLLERGTEKKINITFTAKQDVSALTARVHGVMGGLTVPYAVPQKDACDSGVMCPVQKGQTNTYHAVLPVKKAYPEMSLKVKWELIDEDENVVICTLIPVKIIPEGSS